VNPGESVGTTICEKPPYPASGSVMASRQSQSAVADGARLDARDVRAGVRLGDRDGRDHLALHRRHEVAPAELVVPELVQ
jgi:hypothetical protein